ncbi:MAG: HlyD family efflux transporter periplasmic adaptor subunit, partial [Bacteroidota bacterium]
LGDLESDYAIFEKNYTEYFLNKKLSPLSNDILFDKLSISEAETRLNILKSQLHLNQKELELKKNDMDRFESLLQKGAVSSQEYDEKQLNHLKALQAVRTTESTISQYKENLNKAQSNLRGTEIQRIQKENSFLKSTIQSFNQLKRSIKTWESNYVLKSSSKGIVSFLNFDSALQVVNSGDLVFTVIPEHKQRFIGKVKAAKRNSGKIKIGQEVKIRLDNFPDTEFGTLDGKISNISLSTDDENKYIIDIELPRELITSYNKKIEFKQEMSGNVDIITEDLRLLERFFYQFRNIFKN